ncbi:hypothetical protein V7161_24325, partial [Neobacillus drentensis]
DEIKRKVVTLYLDGVENKTDLLNVGEKWYRKRPKKFSALEKHDGFYLDKNSLTDIKVKVEMFHFNNYLYYQREELFSK